MPLPRVDLTHEIVARIQDGDSNAWSDLWCRLHDDLLFVVRCRLGGELRAHLESEDILQSVALEAIGEIDGFTPRGESAFRHFLNLLVTRKIRDRAATFAAQKRRGTVPLTGDDVAAPREPRYHEPERYEALERALLRLDDVEREVVLMHRIEGLPTREIAEKTHRTDAAVRKAYSRALAHLRDLLGAAPPPPAVPR